MDNATLIIIIILVILLLGGDYYGADAVLTTLIASCLGAPQSVPEFGPAKSDLTPHLEIRHRLLTASRDRINKPALKGCPASFDDNNANGPPLPEVAGEAD